MSKKQIQKFILSDNAIVFIKNHIMKEIHIDKPIDENELDKIINIASQWEVDMIDPLSNEGFDKEYDYPEKERNELADAFISEVTGQWNDLVSVPDFDDLNKRLGLIY